MLRRLIDRFFRRRHPWRSISFDELSELYTSSLLRSLANSLIGIFVPIYLYKLGFSVHTIFGFYAVWFLFRPLYDYLNGFLIGRVGPKHGLALAAFAQVAYLSLLLSLKTLHWPLFLLAQFGSYAMSLFLLSFNVDFSKIKHTERGGTELGYIATLEKLGGIIGPLVGGLIANFFDPRYTIALAIGLQIVAVVPLFLSMEAVRTRQRITYKGLPWRRHKADFLSRTQFSIENQISVTFWPLFLAVAILGDNVFAKIGAITAVSTLISFIVIRVIGRQIDNSRGWLMLRTGTILNAGIHISRLFVQSTFGALAVNMANDPVTASYQMPYIKGMFDAADSVPGYRIAYLTIMGMVDSCAKLLLCVSAWLLTAHFAGPDVLRASFVLAAVCSLGIMSERYPALRRL